MTLIAIMIFVVTLSLVVTSGVTSSALVPSLPPLRVIVRVVRFVEWRLAVTAASSVRPVVRPVLVVLATRMLSSPISRDLAAVTIVL